MLIVLRTLATVVGALILAAATWATIETNHLAGPHAVLVAAMATGLVVGAVVIGRTKWRLAIVIALAMLAGEAYVLLTTAERIVIAREAAQAPLRDAGEARAKAMERVRAAEANMSNASPRLEAALAAKAVADSAATSKAAERGCAVNCRALLEQQVAAAAAEVEAARADIARRNAVIGNELADARAAVAALPASRSSSPLADRVGVPPWLVDVIAAGLLAIGANGLAVALIAWGSHAEREPKIVLYEAMPADGDGMPPASINSTPIPRALNLNVVDLTIRALPAPDDLGVVEYLERCTRPASGIATPVGSLYANYQSWCATEGRSPASLTRFGYSLSEAGARKTRVAGRVVVVDLAPIAA